MKYFEYYTRIQILFSTKSLRICEGNSLSLYVVVVVVVLIDDNSRRIKMDEKR